MRRTREKGGDKKNTGGEGEVVRGIRDAVQGSVVDGILNGCFDHFNADNLINCFGHGQTDRSGTAANIQDCRLHLGEEEDEKQVSMVTEKKRKGMWKKRKGKGCITSFSSFEGRLHQSRTRE